MTQLIESALHLQERAGLDELTDGEWRRESYVKVFADRVRGFRADLNPSGGLPYPAVVEPIEYYRPLVVDEIALHPRTHPATHQGNFTRPLHHRSAMWHPEHSRAAYPTREKLMTDCVPILRQEIELLREAGADTIQLDEPWLSNMVDPSFREREGVSDIQYEMDQCVDFINQTLDGIEGVDTGMHPMPCALRSQTRHRGSYDLIMPTLAKVRVDTISMEYATPVAGGLNFAGSIS